MNRVGRAVLMLTIGVFMTRLLISGGFGWFVQQHMKYPLGGAAVVLVIFGLYELVSASLEERREPDSSSRFAGPGVGWLLVAPLMVLVSVAPTGLGAAAADRVDAYTPTERTRELDPLPESDGPLEMRVFDFLERAIWDGESLEGRTIRLEGLVVDDPDNPGAFRLTRFMVSCCAADGIPLQVTLHHDDPPYAEDTWVQVDLQWRAPTTPYAEQTPIVVEADAVSITVDPTPPDDPYESPY